MEPEPLSWHPGWPEVAAVASLALAYGVALRRHPASRARRAAFAAGAVLLVLAFATPLQTLATEYLLSAHLLQNVVLAEWAPALLGLGIPPSLAATIARVRAVRIGTHPAVALPLWLVTYAAWHVPAPYDAALRHQDSLLLLEHACYLATGLALFWSVFQVDPWRLGPGTKAAYLFGAFFFASPIGLLLALLPDPIYGFYEVAPRAFDLSPIRDQQIAGILMSAAEAAVFFGLFALYFVRFLREEERRASEQDRAHASAR